MKIHNLIPLLGLALLAGPLVAAEPAVPVTVDPARCVIVTPKKSNGLIEYAVTELQHHLRLITGVQVPAATKAEPGTFPIYVGERPADDREPFAKEEARWRVTPAGIWLYGYDHISSMKNRLSSPRALAMVASNQAGSLFAVYEFLETNLGVRWIEPGEAGIAYEPAKTLALHTGRGGWVAQLQQRHMRTAYKDAMIDRAVADGNLPKDLALTEAEVAQGRDDEQVWQRRMRMGGEAGFTYGHAFRKWWDKYGEAHPEWFALRPDGKRGPTSEKMADRVKMCVSNEALVRQVVHDHFARRGAGLVVNACENDSRGFCTCPLCQALDVLRPGEENLPVDDRVLTDRYVHFTNAVLREARKVNPNARTVFYAYSRYNYPPRREKLDPGVILFLLPNLAMSDAENQTYFAQWKAAGATEVYMRPNDLCQDTGLPTGFDEHMFMKLKTAQNYLELRGTDYDSCWGFWTESGVDNYIMARGFYRPDRSFADWNTEYCQAYGAAATDIAAYNTYWRQIWNNRVMPNLDRIGRLTAGVKLMRTKLSQLTYLLYSEKDFDATDALLKQALTRRLTDGERKRVETLVLGNEHNRLKFHAMVANRMLTTASPETQRATSQALYDFRLKHRTELNINWDLMIYLENTYSDNAGTKRLLGTETPKQKDYRLSLEEKLKENDRKDEYPLY